MNNTSELDKIKARAQFFKRGHIIPRRILGASKRKLQHLVKFGSDAWVIPTKTGYLCICELQEGDSAIQILRSPKVAVEFTASPYHKNGTGTHWIGNHQQNKEDFEISVLDKITEKNNGVWGGPCSIVLNT